MSAQKQKSPIFAQFELAGGQDFDWSLLPSKENNRRWNSSMKSYVVLGIKMEKITRDELMERFPDISNQELTSWELRHERDGQAGLRVTRIQHYDGRNRQIAQKDFDFS